MRLFPLERFVLDVDAAPDDVRERLLGATPVAFTGTVGTRSFDLRPVLEYNNSFTPIVRGSFSTGVAGTRVEVRLHMLRAVAIFMAVWLSLAAAFFVVMVVVAFRDPSRAWLPLVGIAFFALGYSLMAFGFGFEARRTRRKLALVLAGTRAGELPRMDLSWLTDLRLPDAEAPERRFNRAFLTIYAVSGALLVFAWERTVSSCSNFQYHRRDTYSCPSGGRIAFTWVLLAALVLAGLGSRVAIHKRARRVYVPLVVLVAVLGAIAAWLITHHPRWGIPR